ncbi:MAG: hypothetical protein AAGJ11_18755 [Bacteroidota bacterium]
MLARLAIVVACVLLIAACDSSVDAGPLFEALEGTWTSEVEPETVRFLPNGRYEFVAGGIVTEAGRVSLASDGAAPDPDALDALREIQFFADRADLFDFTAFQVVSADAATLTIQQCFVDCEGVPEQVYRRR